MTELSITPASLYQIPVLLSAGSIENYMTQVSAIPVISVEHEQKLARQLRDENNLDAARELVLTHLRFVAHIARGYSGYGLALSDLIQEGNIGLMKAVKRFDPDMGVRLVSFAVHWIRAEIHEFIIRNWRIVKIATTKAQRKLFFKLRSSKKRVGWLNHNEVQTIAQDLGVEPAAVLEMEKRLNGQDVAFDRDEDSDEQNSTYAPSQFLQAPEADPAAQLEEREWDEQSLAKLETALSSLDNRSRAILQRRWLNDDKPTLHELADEYGISAERIRQLESNAIKKLRTTILAA